MTAADADAGQTLVYSISGGADAAQFTIDPATGALRFVAAPDFENPADNGANNTYNVTVRVDDGAGGADTQALAVRVTDVTGISKSGSSSADSFVGSGENDTLNGAGGANSLSGLGGNDTLNGGGGGDTMAGGDGNDRLTGGSGADVMSGGAGADRFILTDISESTASARDVILDFMQGADRIELSGIDANTSQYGNQAFVLLGQDAAITGAGQLSWSYVTIGGVTHTIVQGNVNSNLAPDFTIDLVGQIALTPTDFVH